MATRQRVRKSRVSRPRNNLLWATASVNPNAVLGNNTLNTSILDGVPTTLTARATVTRIVGTWAVRPLLTDSTVAMVSSIYVLSQEAFSAGAFLEPETDEASYMWTDMVYIRGSDLNGAVNNQYVNRPIDIRVKRKVRSKENILVFTSENTLGDQAERVFYLRILLQLP